MLNFEYLVPTKVIFGKGTEEETGRIIKSYGAKKVLFIYGEGSIKKSGLYEKIKKNLENSGLSYIEAGGVKPNPTLDFVQETISLCLCENADFILAAGGGSVIDTAKAVSVGIYSDQLKVWDYFTKKQTPHRAMPVGVILTIAAAGSETSNSCVITNEEYNDKRGIRSELVRPVFAILNPEFTCSLPERQTAAGIADMMAHVMERYFTKTKNVDLTDRLCEGVLKSVIDNGLKALKEPWDYNSRAELMWAGSIAHNELLNTGRQGDWGSHHLGHQLSAYYGISHGESLTIMFPAWIKYVYKNDINLFAKFFNRVFNVEYCFDNPEITVLRGIEVLEAYWRQLGMPVSLHEAGIQAIADEKLHAMAVTLLGNSETDGNFYKITHTDIVNIYKLAM